MQLSHEDGYVVMLLHFDLAGGAIAVRDPGSYFVAGHVTLFVDTLYGASQTVRFGVLDITTEQFQTQYTATVHGGEDNHLMLSERIVSFEEGGRYALAIQALDADVRIVAKLFQLNAWTI